MNIKLHIGLFLSCCFLLALSYGCQNKEPAYLSEKKMQEILFELHLADVLAEGKGGSMGFRHAIRSEHYDEVLETFGVSRPEFYRTYVHYLNNPEVLDSIYARLVKTVDDSMEFARQEDYNMSKDPDKWNRPSKPKLDSLNRKKETK